MTFVGRLEEGSLEGVTRQCRQLGLCQAEAALDGDKFSSR